MLRITGFYKNYKPLIDWGQRVKVNFGFSPLSMGTTIEDNTVGTWSEHIFKKRPSFEQIKEFILTEINKQTDEKILSGFTWKDMQVWLSLENQFNYKAAYDLAVQTNGANLPIVFKFGSTEEPIYYKFDTIEELTDFYTKAVKFINEQLAIGWAKKDSINWDDYKL